MLSILTILQYKLSSNWIR